MQQYSIFAFADEADSFIPGQIAAMQRNGLKGLEIRNVDGTNITDISLEKAREVRRQLDDHGLVTWSLGSPIGKQKIAKDFAVYYDLFNKYKSDYQAGAGPRTGLRKYPPVLLLHAQGRRSRHLPQ